MMMCRFENFESAAHAVRRHTTNYAHSLFNKDINLCAVCSWDLCIQLHFTCSCTAVARAQNTQLPHDNRHWTCKRLSPWFDSRFDSSGNFRLQVPTFVALCYRIGPVKPFLLRAARQTKRCNVAIGNRLSYTRMSTTRPTPCQPWITSQLQRYY